MLKCGITGSTGNLGKSFIKNNKKFKFIKFKGDITKKNDVNIWIKKYKFDLIIHFAALVPVSKVNKDYKKALKINYLGTQNIVNAIVENNVEIDWFFFRLPRTFIHLNLIQLKRQIYLIPYLNTVKQNLWQRSLL